MHWSPCNVEVSLKAFLSFIWSAWLFIPAEVIFSCHCPGKFVLLLLGQFSSELINGPHLQVILGNYILQIILGSVFYVARDLLLAQWQQVSCAEATSAALSKFLWCEWPRLLRDEVCVCKLIRQDAEHLKLPPALGNWGCPQSCDLPILNIIWGLKANESIMRTLAASLQKSSGWTQRSWALDGNWIFINSCESVPKQLGHINEFLYDRGKTRYYRDLLSASVWCMRK